MEFQDQVIVITGGAGGIGWETAREFGRQGGRIAVVDRNKVKACAAAQAVKEEGAPDAIGIECDVSQEQQVQKTVDQVVTQWGRLDVVVNNAGVMTFKPLVELTAEDWWKVLQVDLLGAFFFIKNAFQHMKTAGAIVNVSSIHAIETTPGTAPYAAAKAGLLSLTRSAALEGKKQGVRVNAVLPGAIDTPMLWNNPNVKAGLEKIQRTDVGRPEDIARVIVFLASRQAAFVQGASILVDGGRLSQL